MGVTTQLPILCNNCTHSFSISRYERYTTCSSCGTHLMIEESEESITTIIIPKRDLTLEIVPVQVQLSLTELKHELKLLKADWKIEENKFKLIKDRNQKKTLPSKSRGLIKSIGGVSFALIFFFGDFDIFFLSIIGIAWASQGLYELYYWNQYNTQKAEYQEQLKILQENILFLS